MNAVVESMCINREGELESGVKATGRLNDHLTQHSQQLHVLLQDLCNVEILHSTKQHQLTEFKDTCITEQQHVKVTVTNY